MTADAQLKAGTRIICFSCRAEHDPTRFQSLCTVCGSPLSVVRDFAAVHEKEVVDRSVESMWRYHELLPIPVEHAVTLGEGWTPLIDLGDGVFVKDESINPTGSFKDRGMSMAVSAARILGASRLVAPSAGNAGVALAAYGQHAGLPVLVAMPDDTPSSMISRCRDLDAEVILVAGDISVAGRRLPELAQPGDFNLSTLREPYRVEGKKTMGYEIWEQFSGDLPDFVFYPTGGGTGLVGMWKAWREISGMGMIGPTLPKLVSVQSTGCAPIVKAFQEGSSEIVPWPNPVTSAWGLRVPSPVGGAVCLRALRETGGSAIAVSEQEIHETTARLRISTGIDFCPEGGAAWCAMEQLRNVGLIEPDHRVLVWNTGSGASYR